MTTKKQLAKEQARIARGEASIDLSTLTEAERKERLLERFAWDCADIVWETHPDDEADPDDSQISVD